MQCSADIRLLAIDLDGTLLNDRKEVTDCTLAAVADARQAGIKVVIASARPPRSVRHVYRQLQLDTWQINYNGALIWDEVNSKAVFHQPLAGALVQAMICLARDLDPQVLVSCEILDRWYTDHFDPHAASSLTTETGRLFRPDVVAPCHTFWDQDITKLMLLDEPTRLGQVAAAIRQRYSSQVVLIQTEPQLLQITHIQCSKANALQRIVQHYGLAPQQVMAIGDAENDIPMLELAGVAVAMDNAPPAVKAAADWVAPSNNDHGVHAALRRWGLCR